MAIGPWAYPGLDLVLCTCNCFFWDRGAEGHYKVERAMSNEKKEVGMGKLTDFAKGIIIGFCVGIVIVGITADLLNRHRKDKELIEYAEKKQAIEALREDYGNRDPIEFLDSVPGVRGAVDSAKADFERRRGEAVQRFRNRLVD